MAARIVEARFARPLPRLGEMNEYFWRSGKDGVLRILRCNHCGTYHHPYVALCSACLSSEVSPAEVSGRGTVVAITVNYQPWFPKIPVPYSLGLVELEEQSTIRLLTNLDGPMSEVVAGMKVKVYFERHGDIFIPLFEPVGIQEAAQ